MTPLPLATTSGGLPINRHSRSIEKRHKKNKKVYKPDVVMQMWQKAFNESKRSGSGSVEDSPDSLLLCQDILESMQSADEMYAAALQLFVKEPSYHRLFANMKPEHWLGFLNSVVPMPPYIPHPPPPSNF